MRYLILIITVAAMASCQKKYDCECTDWTGDTYTKQVEARTRLQAKINCEDADYLSLKVCELK